MYLHVLKQWQAHGLFKLLSHYVKPLPQSKKGVPVPDAAVARHWITVKRGAHRVVPARSATRARRRKQSSVGKCRHIIPEVLDKTLWREAMLLMDAALAHRCASHGI